MSRIRNLFKSRRCCREMGGKSCSSRRKRWIREKVENLKEVPPRADEMVQRGERIRIGGDRPYQHYEACAGVQKHSCRSYDCNFQL